MGPLSAKQQREWAKHHAKEARESAKMESEESRKNKLHEIKLQEAAAKANQGIGHKEEAHGLKMKELGGPLGGSKRMNRQKLGLPSNNPLAGAEVFSRGQHMLPKGTDTVPAMLTPGEAVIPKAAAQDPKNKSMIKKMVQEGRTKQYAMGTTEVPAYYAIGSESIPNVTANYYHTDSAAALSDGTTSVQYFTEGVEEVERKQLAKDQAASGIVGDLALGAAAMPAAIVGTPLAMGYNKLADAGEWVANSRLGNFVSGNTDDLKIPRIERPNLVKANWQDTGDAIANTVKTAQTNSQPKPVSVSELNPEPVKPEVPQVFSSPTAEDRWVSTRESNNDPMAKNPLSSAKGLYQMTDPAWVDAIKQNPKLAGVNRDLPESQQLGRDAYKAVLAKQLQAQGITPTEEAIRKAWVVGAGGYSNIINADPNAPLAVSAEAMRINPNFKGKTNGEFIADANPYSIKGKGYVPEPRIQAKATDPEQKKLDQAYKEFKKGGPLPAGAPTEIAERDTRIAEFSKSIIDDENSNKKIDQIVNDKNSAPEIIKNKLTSLFKEIYGPTGMFNDRELLRFSLLASASKAFGYNTAQSVRYAARDTLAAADKRYTAEASARVESAKNQRELLERLDQDYRTALGANVSPQARKAAMDAWGTTKNVESKRKVIEFIRSQTDHNTGEGSKPNKPEIGYIGDKQVQYRNYQGNNQVLDSTTGDWKSTSTMITPKLDYDKNRDDIFKSSVNRIAPLLHSTYSKGDKNYSMGVAEGQAKAHAEALALLHGELGGTVDKTSFAKMAENTMRSAIDTAKASGTQLTEEGIRKAFYGNAVIEGRVGSNKDLYMTKDPKNPLPSAEYQVVLGNFLDNQKKTRGLNAGEASNALEKAWESLDKNQKKKYTDMSKGAPGSTPMLFWLYSTGGKSK